MLGKPTGEAFVLTLQRVARAIPSTLRPAGAATLTLGARSGPLVKVRASSLAALQADAQKIPLLGRWCEWPASRGSGVGSGAGSGVGFGVGSSIGGGGGGGVCLKRTASTLARTTFLYPVGEVCRPPLFHPGEKAFASTPIPQGPHRLVSSSPHPFFWRDRCRLAHAVQTKPDYYAQLLSQFPEIEVDPLSPSDRSND